MCFVHLAEMCLINKLAFSWLQTDSPITLEPPVSLMQMQQVQQVQLLPFDRLSRNVQDLLKTETVNTKSAAKGKKSVRTTVFTWFSSVCMMQIKSKKKTEELLNTPLLLFTLQHHRDQIYTNKKNRMKTMRSIFALLFLRQTSP